jgi:outer membrane protein OmpA-like peptidoglycan-associated protein
MLGSPLILKRSARSDAERPFWISYADLMSALMVMFLVVMSVALLAVTRTVTEAERSKTQRDQRIAQFLQQAAAITQHYPGVTLDAARGIIDFGERARFDQGKHTLSAEQARTLRALVPEILALARSEPQPAWLRRVAVEGFASPEGSYLYNLNLSMQRSQRVLCVLLARPPAGERPMSQQELDQIRDLFLVGGFSFNAPIFDPQLSSYDASRRVELRLEFRGLDEQPAPPPRTQRPNEPGKCPLDA